MESTSEVAGGEEMIGHSDLNKASEQRMWGNLAFFKGSMRLKTEV